MENQEIIFHLDLDAFFASVEENINPKLRNHPIIVAGKSKRTVVASANYLARKFNIKAGEPVFMALNKCPQAILVTPHFSQYSKYSKKFMDLLSSEFTPLIEIASIDECFLNATKLATNYDDAVKLAKTIQQTVMQRLHLGVSIGISENKFLAKMATDINKPLGITKMLISDIQTMLWPMKIKDMYGIGKSTLAYLESLKIKTIGDLANFQEQNKLQTYFKNTYSSVIGKAWGRGSNVVNPLSSDPKTISVSETLISDSNDFSELQAIISRLANEIYYRMVQSKMNTTTVGITLKNSSFVSSTKSHKYDEYIYSSGDLVTRCLKLFNDFWKEDAIRLVGINLSNLKHVDEIMIPIKLFSDKKTAKPKENKKITQLQKVVNQVNKELGDRVIGFGNELKLKKSKF
ncbi:Y-family DNA polymerase [[Mycoplasma] testudinis]|uniref:Y-family DNA polymerase n=1 Tax=[Mycoplasma] testudinis TaxID=33924 RepID=UPI0004888447|nr:DNA polymerase IV [[Mycoplasma] testudinis]